MEQLQKLIEHRTQALQAAGSNVSKNLTDSQRHLLAQDQHVAPLMFVQNTKNVGSMARYHDEDFGGRKKTDSAHIYTLAANLNQNTFQQDTKGLKKKSQNDRDFSDSDPDHPQDDSEESDSLDSQINIVDMEAEHEYDQQNNGARSHESFEHQNGSEDSQRKPSDHEIKSAKKRASKARQFQRKKEEGKVLTFVDMSHLSYLSKSVQQNNHLQKKHEQKPVVIPANTKVVIEEDVSEEDYNSEDASEEKEIVDVKRDITVQQVANEIFEQILNVIFEAHDPNHVYKYDIVDNQLLRGNIQQLHKQFFVKDVKLPQVKHQQRAFGPDAFKRLAKANQKKMIKKEPEKTVAEPQQGPNSLMSVILESQDPDAFIIQPPDKKSKMFLETKIYFWETSTCIKIKISTNDITYDVIRHIMTLYKQSPFQKSTPLKYTDPNRYALWLIDEYDRRNKYRPDEELGPRPMRDPIGQFESMAFVEVKNFKAKNDANQTGLDEQMQKELQAQGFKQVKVHLSNHFQLQELTFKMHIDWQISKIFELVNDKKGEKAKFSSDKYVLLMVQDDQVSSRAKDAMTKELIERFGGYNAFGTDDRLIDPRTHVRNLKSNTIEIRPKIFTDKPTEKQLDMTFETKMQVMNSSAFKKIDTSQSFPETKQRNQTYVAPNKFLDPEEMLIEKKEGQKRFKDEGDFLYGHVSGTSLEEFVVTKINKRNKAQERLLCIDGFNIHNKEYSKAHAKAAGQAQSLWGSISTKLLGVKTKKRPISSIHSFRRFDPYSFAIMFTNPDKPYEPTKEIRYRVQNPDDCSNIMAKIRFLTTQQQKKMSARNTVSNLPSASNFI